MRPAIILVSRQSPDWGALARDFRNGLAIDPARFTPPEPIPGFPRNIAELVGRWNAEMALDFFSCRARLKEIAESTIARSPEIVRSDYRSVDQLPRQYNSILFFHDDDDWFGPDMADVVSQIPSAGYDVCVFPLVIGQTHLHSCAGDKVRAALSAEGRIFTLGTSPTIMA